MKVRVGDVGREGKREQFEVDTLDISYQEAKGREGGREEEREREKEGSK
jgi:hypothetical protein